MSVTGVVNDRGQIVGWSSPPNTTESHAVLWEDGGIRDLGTLSGGWSRASRVNQPSQIIGVSDGCSFLWEDGVMQALSVTDLGTLGGITGASYSGNCQCTQHALVWRAGVMRDLGAGEGVGPSG
jgi:probable HAF family extracellular repeat protein